MKWVDSKKRMEPALEQRIGRLPRASHVCALALALLGALSTVACHAHKAGMTTTPVPTRGGAEQPISTGEAPAEAAGSLPADEVSPPGEAAVIDQPTKAASGGTGVGSAPSTISPEGAKAEMHSQETTQFAGNDVAALDKGTSSTTQANEGIQPAQRPVGEVAILIPAPMPGGSDAAPETDNEAPVPGDPAPPVISTSPPPHRDPNTQKNQELLLSLSAIPLQPRVGDLLTIEIVAASAARIVDAPLHVIYDPASLRFLDASAGEYLSKDGGEVVFIANGHTRPGEVVIGIGRINRALGLRGAGALCRIRFVALGTGATSIGISRALAWSDTGKLLPVRLASLTMELQPE